MVSGSSSYGASVGNGLAEVEFGPRWVWLFGVYPIQDRDS